ncbi:MAG: tripartite tricarboxylate transporter TctB family protein [Eubacteriales bacterium]|nr:tripartite tricarboxylate transporter TctB family protein [Eubacteriales bacterium]
MSKLKGDTVPGVVSVVLGAAVAGMTLANPEKMAIGETAKKGFIPGPGFFPLLCAGLLLVFGICLTVRGLLENGKVDFFKMTPEIRENLKTLLKVFGGLVGFLLLWKFFSKLFILWVAIYAAYLCIVFKRSVLFTIIFTIVMTALIYFMFMVGFSVTFRVY